MTGDTIDVQFNMLDKNNKTNKDLHTHIKWINFPQTIQVLTNLSSVSMPKKRYGLCGISLSFLYDVNTRGNKHGVLNVNRMFDNDALENEEFVFLGCTGAWCNCPEMIHKKCTENFISGKCKNQYMRQILGGVLFPEYYNNSNQKQK